MLSLFIKSDFIIMSYTLYLLSLPQTECKSVLTVMSPANSAVVSYELRSDIILSINAFLLSALM